MTRSEKIEAADRGLPPLLTRQQVADLFQVDLRTVDRWGADDILPRRRIGGTVRFRRADVEKLIGI